MSIIDDLTDQIQEVTDNLGEVSDSTSQSFSDVQTTLDDHEERVGKLDFPLDPNTVDLIRELFPTGTVKLTGGSASVADARVSASSIIMLTHLPISGTAGELSYQAYAGGFSVVSTIPAAGGGSDNSVVAYLILN